MEVFAGAMTFTKCLIVLFLLTFFQNDVCGGVLNKRELDENIKNVTSFDGSPYEKSLLGNFEEKNLEQEILQELNHLSFRKQREIFVDLEKQHEKFNKTQKSLVTAESEILSPLNIEELKNIRKTIKASNSSLPAIRNKRTLNFLLSLVARAMGYTLTPSNSDAEWIPRQQPQPSAHPCSAPPPPCRPNPPSTPPPPPCPMPPTTPPCPGSGALMQPATVPPAQINANTISYPYRPSRTIPLFNFAPLPAGIRVPYPPLLQPPAQQRSPCTSQQPLPPPCSTSAPSPPPCNTTPAPQMPQPCKPTPSPSPSPCGTPAPPPPCGTTPAPPPPPPCVTPAPQPPPCSSTPPPKPQPCSTTPAPPPACATPAPASPCTNSTPNPPPCAPPPSPPPCSPPAAPPSKPPKKGSIVLEYDDPVRIEIFSNDKKYLPASGRVYSGDYDEQQQDWHSHFFPSNEKTKNKNNDFEEEEEMQEEHVEEEEEEEETPGHLRHYEEEDERISANSEDEEDESETNLSIVKKPIDQEIKKTQRRKAISSRAKSVTTAGEKRNDKESNKKGENKEKAEKMKKPKRKKWIRIVKKQRRKTKTDSNPHDNFQVYTSDSIPEGSRIYPKIYGDGLSRRDHYSYDVSDFSNDSGSQSTEDLEDFKKVTINKEQIHSPDLEKAYEFNINPYAHALEPEEARRAKLEKAVEKYVEDYVEKQLGQELIKNTGIPKTTVFEFAPKNGPKIQTVTTTVAKTSHSGPGSAANAPPRLSTTARPNYRNPNGNAHIVKQSNYEQTLKKRGNTYEAFTRKF